MYTDKEIDDALAAAGSKRIAKVFTSSSEVIGHHGTSSAEQTSIIQRGNASETQMPRTPFRAQRKYVPSQNGVAKYLGIADGDPCLDAEIVASSEDLLSLRRLLFCLSRRRS